MQTLSGRFKENAFFKWYVVFCKSDLQNLQYELAELAESTESTSCVLQHTHHFPNNFPRSLSLFLASSIETLRLHSMLACASAAFFPAGEVASSAFAKKPPASM